MPSGIRQREGGILTAPDLEMKRQLKAWLTAFVFCSAAALPASAQEIVVGAGSALFDGDTSTMLALEYHGGTWRELGRFKLRFGGGLAFEENGSGWAGVGLSGNVDLGRKWFAEFSFFPGYYNAGSSATRLGSNIEFRTLIGLGYTVSDSAAVSVAIDHRSNAGLDDFNPGVNSVTLRWHRRF
jgi:lipid A 3-O-deacylase